MTAGMLSFGAFLLAPVAVLAPKGTVILLAVTALPLLYLAIRRGHWRQALGLAEIRILGAFLIWALASITWTILPAESLELWTSMALILLGIAAALSAAGALDEQGRDRVLTWAMRGIWLAMVLGTVELTADLPIGNAIRPDRTGLSNLEPTILNAGFSVILCLAWPVAAALWRQDRKPQALGTLLAAVAITFAGEGDSAKLAVVLSGLVFIAVLMGGRRVLDTVAALAAITVVAAPLIASHILTPSRVTEFAPGIKDSALHRIYVWEFTAQRIADKPLAGWGLDSARAIPGGADRIPALDDEDAIKMTLHPHNAALQIWLELGVPGALLAAGLIGVIARYIRRREREARAAQAAAFVAALTVAGLSFGIWQNWWLAALGLLAVIASAVTGEDQAGA